MTAARRLAGILVAGVGVGKHRDGTSKNRANGNSLHGSPKVVMQRYSEMPAGPTATKPKWAGGCDQARLSRVLRSYGRKAWAATTHQV